MPDYNALIKFLLQPLLTRPDELRVDFEANSKSDRLWIRVALDPDDRGRVFGKGGRTIQAIRTVVMAAAQEVGQRAYFEVFDPNPQLSSSEYNPEYAQDSRSSDSLDPQPTIERPRINVEKPKLREITS